MFACSWNFYFFISAFCYISCQACEKGANPEKSFVDDFTKNGNDINKLIVEQGNDEVAKKLCAAALYAEKKLPDVNDLNQVSPDNINPLRSSFLRSPYYKSDIFKDKLQVWPSECSIKNKKSDTTVYFEFASSLDKIYLMEDVNATMEFKFKDIVCVEDTKNNGTADDIKNTGLGDSQSLPIASFEDKPTNGNGTADDIKNTGLGNSQSLPIASFEDKPTNGNGTADDIKNTGLGNSQSLPIASFEDKPTNGNGTADDIKNTGLGDSQSLPIASFEDKPRNRREEPSLDDAESLPVASVKEKPKFRREEPPIPDNSLHAYQKPIQGIHSH